MIYITYPNCLPDITILAQAVLQIFCSQGCFTTQNAKVGKREIIYSNIYRILLKVNQVIYTQSVSQNIMILAQMVLEIFCSQSSIGLQWESWKMSKKGHNSATTSPTEKKKIRFRLYFMVIPNIKFQDPISNRSWPCASETDARTDSQTHGQA